MALITKPVALLNGTVASATDVESDFNTIYNDYNGNILNENIASGAAIDDTKLAQITSTNKVNGTSFTNLAGITSAAGLIPSANLPSTATTFTAGMILMWHGSIATIPNGWNLCDGTSGTVDLRNCFVVCADADVGGKAKTTLMGSATTSGGSVTIATANLPSHTHDISYGFGGVGPGPHVVGNVADPNDLSSADTSGTAGNGTAYAPPYYALAYIQKL